MSAYYNEIDPFAAQWLRDLVAAGHIAPGDVDTRSIEDVSPDDLKPYTQCHFFAGIGVWSYALRRAGWDDDRPIWTGSCPCQPFSAAGKGGGFADERHLWPAFNHLIQERRPSVVLGEQVASKDGLAWIDLVQTDMEGQGYAFGATDLCAAGFGAPNIRQRLYWVGHTDDARLEGWQFPSQRSDQRLAGPSCLVGGMASASCQLDNGSGSLRTSWGVEHPDRSDFDRLAVNACIRCDEGDQDAGRSDEGDRSEGQPAGFGTGSHDGRPNPTNGFWSDADWLFCTDGKFRPVEPGSFPLVDGAPARVGRLRGYGNAINAEVATGFAEVVKEILDEA